MTLPDQIIFAEFLHVRLELARAEWLAAKIAYLAALQDHVDFALRCEWREELEAEWRTSAPRKPVRSEGIEREGRKKA